MALVSESPGVLEMKSNVYLCLLLTLFTSCQENPLGSKATIGSNFYPGLGAPPQITLVSPNNGPSIGGTNITVTGTGFTLNSIIKIGGVPCGLKTYVSPTSIVCLTPPHTIGAKDLLIENSDGRKHVFAQSFNYISNVAGTPGFGIVSGGKKTTSASLSMQSTIGEPIIGETMTGVTTQLKVGVSGILFTPE